MRLAVSVVIPAFNEGTAIVPVLDRIFDGVQLECEILVVTDFEKDSTVPVLRDYATREPRLKALVSSYGRG
ncbi:MAG: dolichol-phosphate mannosyltransferase, partial [Actinomycetota bacterium]|nr:dolichol-phosphate mannosyltransferase [Actinomycetota bacterium]